MAIEKLTEEQKEKLRGASSTDEVIALAQEEGIELTDDQLEQISGGATWSDEAERYADCPYCGRRIPTDGFTGSEFEVVCDKCLGVFWVSRSD